jgi:hypothetical protein
MKKIAEERNLFAIFEPFSLGNNQDHYGSEMNDVVVKTIINQHPPEFKYEQRIEWLSKFVTEFDEVILLTRRDLKACAESFAYLCHHWKTRRFRHVDTYVWEPSPNLDSITNHILQHNEELKNLSQILNIPITYYEDIFDPNSTNRLRKT